MIITILHSLFENKNKFNYSQSLFENKKIKIKLYKSN